MKKSYSIFNGITGLRLLLFILASVKLPGLLLAQQEVDLSKYSQAYYDSIRVLVYDSTNQNYIIDAYPLSENEEVKIDGKLDEPAWHAAQHRGGFLEKEPYPLIPLREDTEFAILYDDNNLYIGVWCWDTEPEKIVQILSPRGVSGPDHLMIFVDSYFDKRTGYKFTVTPTGVQGDELRYDDVKRDMNWNGIWFSEGSVDDKGWYAEIKIPFYNLRFSKKENQTWGFNIMRTMSKYAARGQWKPHLPEWENTTRMSQLGEIRNIRNIKSGRMFEVRPYGTLSNSETIGIPRETSLNFGGDIRFSPTPNLTADFTINPDFAQVDADVFEINLTRFPTRFKELRPFFTERINVFNTPLELFYSRRIGARGNIRGGIKATGKLKGGLEFGVLGNTTGESFFSGSSLNEKASFGVVRIKKDILGSSSIGIPAATKEEKDKYNRIVGIDGSFVLSGHDIVDIQFASGEIENGGNKNKGFILSYLRTGDLIGLTGNVEKVEPFFEINRVGYIQKELNRGWNKAGATFRISPRINKNNIRRVHANLNMEFNQDLFTDQYINNWLKLNPEKNPDQLFGNVDITDDNTRIISDGERKTNNLLFEGELSLNTMNEMEFLVGYQTYEATEITGKYSGNLFNLNYSSRPVNKGARIAGIFDFNTGTIYNFQQKYVGAQQNYSLNGEGRLGKNFLTKLEGAYTNTNNPDGDRDGRYFKISSNSTLMFTKYLYFRLHAQAIFGTTWYQQKQIFNEYLLSGLLSWEYKPGSFLYLAYNEGRFDSETPESIQNMVLNNRTLILKFSYFFSL